MDGPSLLPCLAHCPCQFRLHAVTTQHGVWSVPHTLLTDIRTRSPKFRPLRLYSQPGPFFFFWFLEGSPLTVSSCGWKGPRVCPCSLLRTLIPCMKTPTSWSQLLPKASPSNKEHWEWEFSVPGVGPHRLLIFKSLFFSVELFIHWQTLSCLPYQYLAVISVVLFSFILIYSLLSLFL